MAVNLVSPGVNTREVDLTTGGIRISNSQVGGIAGPFARGPVEEPTLITSESSLVNIFGKPQKIKWSIGILVDCIFLLILRWCIKSS